MVLVEPPTTITAESGLKYSLIRLQISVLPSSTLYSMLVTLSFSPHESNSSKPNRSSLKSFFRYSNTKVAASVRKREISENRSHWYGAEKFVLQENTWNKHSDKKSYKMWCSFMQYLYIIYTHMHTLTQYISLHNNLYFIEPTVHGCSTELWWPTSHVSKCTDQL